MHYHYFLLFLILNTNFFYAMKQEDNVKNHLVSSIHVEEVMIQLKSLQTKSSNLLNYFCDNSNKINTYLALLPPDNLRLVSEYYVHEKERVKASYLTIPHASNDYHADCYCSSCLPERRRKQEAWESWKNNLYRTGYNIGYYGSMAVIAGGALTVFLSLKREEQNKIADKMFEASVDLLKKTVEEAAKGPYVPSTVSAPVVKHVVDQAMEKARYILPILQQMGVRISLEAVYAMIKSGVDPLRYYGQQTAATLMGRR